MSNAGSGKRSLVLGAIPLVLGFVSASWTLALAQDEPPAFLVGTWEVSSVATENVLTDITLGDQGEYKGGNWGVPFGGPNGIGATRYKYAGGILTFYYPHDARRPDDMLVGSLKRDAKDPNRYEFKVTGGYYGQGRARGTLFRMQRTGR
jgi:hypothetical protein